MTMAPKWLQERGILVQERFKSRTISLSLAFCFSVCLSLMCVCVDFTSWERFHSFQISKLGRNIFFPIYFSGACICFFGLQGAQFRATSRPNPQDTKGPQSEVVGYQPLGGLQGMQVPPEPAGGEITSKADEPPAGAPPTGRCQCGTRQPRCSSCSPGRLLQVGPRPSPVHARLFVWVSQSQFFRDLVSFWR